MTTRAYVHSPTAPFTRIAGPIAVSFIERQTGLSVNSFANLNVAFGDIQLQWLRNGMCWAIEQEDIGEVLWAGFVDVEQLPMDAESVPIRLVGPKEGLLSVEWAVRLPGRVSAGFAVREALVSVQTRGGGIRPGEIEEVGPAIQIDARAETVSQFIDTIKEQGPFDWRERIVQRDNELDFVLDFGLLQKRTNIVLSRNEIVTGIFSRSRVPASFTELGSASSFAERPAATVAGGARQTRAAEPTDGIFSPQNEVVAELLRNRDIGPGAVKHLVEVSERVAGGDIEVLAQQRHEEALRDVDEILLTLDGTKADAQRVQLGDVVKIDVPSWLPSFDVNANVHVRHITPEDTTGERDVVATVLHESRP